MSSDRLVDRPIRSIDEDLLNREAFAVSIAKVIKGWIGKEDSLILSLNGEWGSGKSSILNMVNDYFTGLPSEQQPIIIHFNPWEWAGQGNFMKEFFTRIGQELGRDNDEHRKKLAKLWSTVGAYFTASSSFATGIQKLCISLLALSSVAVFAGWFNTHGTFKAVLTALGGIAAVISALLVWWGGFAEKVSKAVDSRLKLDEKSIREKKEEFGRILAQEMNTNVLIVIDDIDRLAKEEIKELFQLVKANANLPNMVYLLLFQHSIVETALEDYFPKGSVRFLEKIIQRHFNIPLPERTRIEDVLITGVRYVIEKHNISELYDENKLSTYWIHGCRLYFDSLRVVKRFLGTLDMLVGMFGKSGAFEVNPVDLFVLETLRHFEPEVYAAIPAAGFALTGEWSGPVLQQFHNEERKHAVEHIFSQANKEEVVKELMPLLFPRVPAILKGEDSSGGRDEESRRRLLVCHRDVFERYFTLSIPDSQVSEVELKHIIHSVGNENFKDILGRYISSGRLADVLKQLVYYVDDVKESTQEIITALFDIGDSMPVEEKDFFGMTTTADAIHLIDRLLEAEDTWEKRTDIVLAAMQSSKSVYLPSFVLIQQSRNIEEGTQSYLSKTDMSLLTDYCIGKIYTAVSSGHLAQLPMKKMIIPLFAWSNFGPAHERVRWIESNILSNHSTLIAFLKAFMRTSPDPFESIDLGQVEKLIQVDSIEQCLQSISDERMTADDKNVIKEFNKSFANRRGKTTS